MYVLSPSLLWHKSKRIVVKLVSAAQTGSFYVTEKSPTKKDFRMALRKHDPIVNQHVMFYEQKNLTASQSQKLMRKRSVRNMRFTAKRVDQLVKQEERRLGKGVGVL